MPLKDDWRPGESGISGGVNSVAAKANELDDLVTSGRLADGAIVPNTPEGRTALAGSTELSAAIVESGNVPVDYTWDATTGFIATITEHYPAPIGNRVTTYSSYGDYGPTHEVDPDGGAWTLTYDSNGNPIGRSAA